MLRVASFALAALLFNTGCIDVCSEYEGSCAEPGGTGGGGTGGGAQGGSGSSSSSSTGEGGAGGSGPPALECEPEEGNQPTPGCGIFVDPDAPAGGDGSKDAPFSSLAAATGVVSPGDRIYVCGGATHEGGIGVPAGADVIGGYLCGDWSYSTANPRAVIAGVGLGPAFRVSGTEGETTLTSLRIVAPDAALPGTSSIGMILEGGDVTLRYVDVEAGLGADARDAETRPAHPDAPDGNDGANACTNQGGGGAQVTNACADTTTVGGTGGTGTSTAVEDGGDGVSGLPALGLGQRGEGQPSILDTSMTWGCTSGELLGRGSNGQNGSNGSPGAGGTAFGSLDATGYFGASGTPGGPGTSGQGGGGAGARRGVIDCQPSIAGEQNGRGASGGSGGAGGCGGLPGEAGGAGGSSFGVVSLAGTLTLVETTVTAKAAGDGGNGAGGQVGGGGGSGGLGGQGAAAGCNGGAGGTGGTSGGGGGGHGGHSAAIVHFGTLPELGDTSTLTGGAPGAAGLGVVPRAGGNGNPGTACLLLDFAAEACTDD